MSCYADWAMVLEYLKVLLSWPPLATSIALIFLWLFRKSISSLIDRIKTIEALGGKFEAAPIAQQSNTKTLPRPEEPPSEKGISAPLPKCESAVIAKANSSDQQSALSTTAGEQQPKVIDWLAYHSSDPDRAKMEILRWWQVAKFESIFNVIYGTQVRMMQVLSQVGSTGESKQNIQVFHDEHVRNARSAGLLPSPEANFYAFLTKENLIQFHGDRVYITDWGNNFLVHIQQIYGSMGTSMRAF